MAKFKVTETAPAFVTYTYTVEAENEEEAVMKMLNGEAGNAKVKITHTDEDGEIEAKKVK